MANNFLNKMVRNVSADETAPSLVYKPGTGVKTIVIELDVANRSTSSQTISVLIEDFSEKGPNKPSSAGATTGTITATGHGYSTGDRIRLTNSGTSSITYNSAALSETAVWYVIVVNANSFKLALSHANATAGTAVTLAGSAAAADIWNSLAYTYVVRDAPIPIGGALKVIAGQKLVLEGQDSLFVTASSASSVDAIGSILEAVS